MGKKWLIEEVEDKKSSGGGCGWLIVLGLVLWGLIALCSK